MNKIIIYCSCLLLIGGMFTSCKKFLEESSQDEIRPGTTQDLTEIMNFEAYRYYTVMDSYVDLLTDDVQCTGLPLVNGNPSATHLPYLENGAPMFTFNPGMFDNTGTIDVTKLSGVDSWKLYYGKIKGCNVVMDYIDKVSGTEQEKNSLLGQCLFLRAFYYLKLVTLYGQPYSGVGIDPSVSPGVPLVLSSAVTDNRIPRSTLAEVYSQIETDLLKASDLLENNFKPTSFFRAGHQAAWALLSRLYLYMGRDEDMDKVIMYTDKLLAERPGLTQLTTYFTSATAFTSAGIYDANLSNEVIWTNGNNTNSLTVFYPAVNAAGSALPPYSVSQELVNLYDQGDGTTANLGDLRFLSYFSKTSASPKHPYRSFKIGSTQQYGDKGIRVAEVYLNRAEALIRRYQLKGQASDRDQALSDLNTLRQSRYDTRNTTYVPVSISDADALFSFYQDERRRELCLEENHRWCDIKRWGLSVTHHYVDAGGVASDHTLSSGSLLYALPIPYTALERNDALAQNPR